MGKSSPRFGGTARRGLFRVAIRFSETNSAPEMSIDIAAMRFFYRI